MRTLDMVWKRYGNCMAAKQAQIRGARAVFPSRRPPLLTMLQRFVANLFPLVLIRPVRLRMRAGVIWAVPLPGGAAR